MLVDDRYNVSGPTKFYGTRVRIFCLISVTWYVCLSVCLLLVSLVLFYSFIKGRFPPFSITVPLSLRLFPSLSFSLYVVYKTSMAEFEMVMPPSNFTLYS